MDSSDSSAATGSNHKRTRVHLIPVSDEPRCVSPAFENVAESKTSCFFGPFTREESADVLRRTNSVLQSSANGVVGYCLTSDNIEHVEMAIRTSENSVKSTRASREEEALPLSSPSLLSDKIPQFVQFALNDRPAYQPGNVFLVCHDPEDTLFNFLFWQEPNVRNKYRTEEWYTFLRAYEEAARMQDTEMFLQDYSLSADEIRFLDLHSAAKKAKVATK